MAEIICNLASECGYADILPVGHVISSEVTEKAEKAQTQIPGSPEELETCNVFLLDLHVVRKHLDRMSEYAEKLMGCPSYLSIPFSKQDLTHSATRDYPENGYQIKNVETITVANYDFCQRLEELCSAFAG